MNPHFKFGTFIKRKVVEIDVPEEHKGKQGSSPDMKAKRTKFLAFGFDMKKMDNEKRSQLLKDKWETPDDYKDITIEAEYFVEV